MAWIEIIPEDEAEGRLKELYDAYTDQSWGGVDNILKTIQYRSRQQLASDSGLIDCLTSYQHVGEQTWLGLKSFLRIRPLAV